MTIYEQMLARYGEQDRKAHLEVMQQIALAGLYRADFFEHAAFYGGTCLRIFHGLNRFSEDMDFSLLQKEKNFDFEQFFPSIINEFEIAGRTVEITKKDKRNFGKVESAFLKDTTEVYSLTFQYEKNLKIKMEVDTDPPLLFNTEQRLLLLPFSFMTRCFSLPDLFAGKMHALVFRGWKNRVKGRDWYDFEWYVRKGVKLNWEHLHERILQFNGKNISREQFIILLEEKLTSADINQAKADVVNFIVNPQELEIWSNDYFLQLSKMMLFE